MAKVRQNIGENTVETRQLAKVLRVRWRMYDKLSPISQRPHLH